MPSPLRQKYTRHYKKGTNGKWDVLSACCSRKKKKPREGLCGTDLHRGARYIHLDFLFYLTEAFLREKGLKWRLKEAGLFFLSNIDGRFLVFFSKGSFIKINTFRSSNLLIVYVVFRQNRGQHMINNTAATSFRRSFVKKAGQTDIFLAKNTLHYACPHSCILSVHHQSYFLDDVNLCFSKILLNSPHSRVFMSISIFFAKTYVRFRSSRDDLREIV